MKWSIRIGRFAGIDVYMHVTFLLLISWVALLHWQQGQSITAAMAGVIFILAVFLCVVLHEFGHALTARRYGIQTRDITLLPIGGVARLERMPTNPLQELWVALAGPAVNVVIAAILFIWLKLSASFEPVQTLTFTTGPFLERIMAVNLFLVAFNLIPAFPMDGGRVLRALLATRKNYGRATQIAASIGQAIAVFFGVVGLFYNPLLLFIAFFVWIGAAQEASLAQIQSAIGGIPVQQAMLTDFRILHKDDSLDRAIELTLAGSQKDFPVVDDGRVEGILTQTDLLKALSSQDRHQTVTTAMQRDFVTVDSLEMLETAFAKLKDCNCHTLPVTLNAELVGLLTMDNLGEYMRIQAAMKN
ncbi:MAG: site-2 protease family protein [Desulfobacterales bacterium]|nr:MAG: site-2 protease family protein [Desulfobacterales bacterium]